MDLVVTIVMIQKQCYRTCIPEIFLLTFPDTKVADALGKVNDETREDLDNMQKMFEERGIKVHRMTDSCW